MRFALVGEVRSLNLRAWAAMLGVATLFSAVSIAGAQTTPPPLVVSQTNWLAAFPAGRVLTTGNAAGTSFAVNANGEVAVGDTFGNQVLLFNGQTGATEKTWAFLNPGAVAMDGQGNLYVAALNSNWIVKLPYSNGTYADLTTDPQTTPPPACTGSDTQECAWGINLQGNGAFGVASMTFDLQGNFFYVTNGRSAAANQFSIFECGVASGCIAAASTGSGTGAAVKLFSEPAATNPSPYCGSAATMQITLGAIAVDPWGNLFFTDSALDTCGSTDGYIDQSDYSDVNELPLINGSYAAAPVTLYTFMPSPPTPYNDQIVGVAVDAKGTVYFSTAYAGVLGFANDGTPFNGPVPQADLYGVWTYQGWTNGARALTVDGKGNLYVVTSLTPVSGTSNIDALARVSLNSLPFPASPIGTATNLTTPQSVTNAVVAADSTVVMVNDADCSSAGLGIAVKQDGVPSSEFAGGAGACMDSSFLSGQSSIPLTLTFTPTKVGARSAVVTAIDIATGNSQAATAFGVGQGGLVALSGASSMTTYVGFKAPVGISLDSAGDLFVADAGANVVDKIASGIKTLSPIGSGFNAPTGVALDANGNLYVADTGNQRVVEIANAAGTPGTQTTVVSSSVTFDGTALNGPTGLAVGADGVLYISDTGNNRVVTYNPANGVTGVRATGLNHPAGIAVDAADTLYVANAGTGSGGNVEVFPGGGGAAITLTANGVTAPVAVAVEASGSVLVSDGPTGAIVRVPNEGGTLNSGDATVVQQNPTQSGGGVALDPAGDLYTTDTVGATVYAVQRTALTVNFGSVQDGATANSFSLSAENVGNMPLAMASGATSFLTQPSSGNFAITAGFPNDCVAATSLAAGSMCEFIAEFTPALGTASGDLTDTADFNSTAVNPTAVITLRGTAEYQPIPVLGFTLAVAAPSLKVNSGGSAGTTVSVTPQGGFNSTVTFSCSGLPAGATCSFSPASVTPSEGAVATTQLTVTASATSAALHQESSPLLPGGAALACVMCFCFGLRKRRGLLAMLLLAACLTGLGVMSGCGVHATPQPKTAMVTVNGVSGSMQGSATFTLSIQP